MKRIFFIATLLVAALSLNAQDCETFMLPFFQGDAARLAEYPAPKLDWRCRYAHNAFYESDVVPEGAQVISISEVTDKTTGKKLTDDFQVDLNTLCYYGYDIEASTALPPRRCHYLFPHSCVQASLSGFAFVR